MLIGILGSVEIWHDGRPLPVGPPMQRCVLAMLATRPGHGHTVEGLVDALWGESPPQDARGLVHGYVSRLRKVLKPTGISIVRRSPGYALDVEPTEVDLLLFRQMVADARAEPEARSRAEGLFTALGLWRGEPLAGIVCGEAVGRLRTGLVQEQVTVTEEWAEQELDLGRHREVISDLTRICAEHPYQEKLVGLLLLALHRSGRQAEALRRYDECRRLLADALGVDPGEELRGLYERILRADPALARVAAAPVRTDVVSEPVAPARRPSTLPFDVPDFTGRDDELAALVERFARPGTVITVDGMAGIGKTALAVHAAHALTGRFPDAQLFVDLHGFTPGREQVDPSSALGTLLRSLGVAPADIPPELDERVAAWRSEMAGRSAVVVLDNAVDAAQVRPLIPGAPNAVVIVTSRRRLPTLDGAVPLSLGLLPPEDAGELFHRVAGTAHDADPVVREIVELCGHLPLAVRVAGARLRHRPTWRPEDLADRLRTEQQRLSELRLDDRDVAAAFALSYRYLEPEHQRAFRLLSVHPGTDVDPYAAAALVREPLVRTEDLLEDLLDHHLLEQRARGRYQFHDLLREHAQSFLGPDDDLRAAGTRLLDYYLTAAYAAAEQIQPGRRRMPPTVLTSPTAVPPVDDHDAAMAWFGGEHQNLVAAARFGVRHGLDEHVSQMPRYIGNYLVINHHIGDLVAIQEPAAAAAARSGDPRSESLSLYHLAMTYYVAGRYRLGLGHATQYLRLVAELGEDRSYAHNLLGMLHQRLGRYGEAMEHTEAAVAAASDAGDARVVAICTGNIARIALATGDLDRARASFGDALVRVRDVGDGAEEASVLSGLGATASRRGDHDLALRSLYEGVELARRVGNVDYALRGLIKLADGHRRAGHVDQARRVIADAITDLRSAPCPDHLSTALNVSGYAATAAGHPAEALTAHRTALDVAERIEYRIEEAKALLGVGDALRALGDDSWISATEEARTRFTAMGVEPEHP